MTAPRNKHESIDLFARGCYGNNIPTYATPEEALRVPEVNRMIRYKGEPGVQGPAVVCVSDQDLLDKWDYLVQAGWKEDCLYISGAIPTNNIVFQGELSTGNWADRDWLLVGCEDAGIHMRDAMKRSTFKATGWRARAYLKLKMDPSSWDDLNHLIDEYPDGIIELVIFNTPYGSLASTGRSCVVWEVRLY